MGITIAILLVLFVFIFFIYSSTPSHLLPLQKSLSEFLQVINQPVPFKLVDSKNYTFTKNKYKIYLYSSHFSFQTLFLVCLHEIAHILCPDEHHTPLFYAIEKDLIQKALQYGYIVSDQVESNYPCFD